MSPCSSANRLPSSNETARRCSRSDLLPISIIVICEFECCRASSSHDVRWLNVSRLRTRDAAAAGTRGGSRVHSTPLRQRLLCASSGRRVGTPRGPPQRQGTAARPVCPPPAARHETARAPQPAAAVRGRARGVPRRPRGTARAQCEHEAPSTRQGGLQACSAPHESSGWLPAARELHGDAACSRAQQQRRAPRVAQHVAHAPPLGHGCTRLRRAGPLPLEARWAQHAQSHTHTALGAHHHRRIHIIHAPGDVVHEQRACCATVVRARDRAERLLARRVPNLQFDLLVVNSDHACTEFHADREVVHRLEPLVCELQQQARLADACHPRPASTVTPAGVWARRWRGQTQLARRADEVHAPVSPMMMYLNRYA
mmetsp:Transcript_22009/g.56558  ORF Transcript_22009/g.56558 Transcript_22009/m.56558 type:complete len:371 (+) Transcript_22009:793-1905(+)